MEEKKDRLQVLSPREVAINEKVRDMLDGFAILAEVLPEHTKALRQKYLGLIDAGFTEAQALELSKAL